LVPWTALVLGTPGGKWSLYLWPRDRKSVVWLHCMGIMAADVAWSTAVWGSVLSVLLANQRPDVEHLARCHRHRRPLVAPNLMSWEQRKAACNAPANCERPAALGFGGLRAAAGSPAGSCGRWTDLRKPLAFGQHRLPARWGWAWVGAASSSWRCPRPLAPTTRAPPFVLRRQ
jgi:hypothetical protein